MPISRPVAQLRGALANAKLRGDLEAADQYKRDLTALVLEQHINRVLAASPPLTAKQRGRIAAVLCAPASGRDDANKRAGV